MINSTDISIFSLDAYEWRKGMVNFIVCDDDEGFVSQLVNLIEASMTKRNIPTDISGFCGAEEISTEVLSECDIAFLDIDFDGESYNGMDIARRLRAQRQDAMIVFVTNYIEYAPEGYEVQAFRYILKEDISRKLEACLDKIFDHMLSAKSSIEIQSDGKFVDIQIQDILYIEALDHTLKIHVLEKGNRAKTYSCYSTLAKMEEELSNRGFLRIHKSYLVNMRHLKSLSRKEAGLSNGDVLSVGRKKYSECREKYFLWKGKM